MTEDDKFEKIDNLISSALEKDAAFDLSPGFADRVVNMVQQTTLEKESNRDKWWLLAGIVSMVVVVVIAFTQIVFTKLEFSPNVGVFTFLYGYRGLVIFAILFVTALHIIDKKVISHRSH